VAVQADGAVAAAVPGASRARGGEAVAVRGVSKSFGEAHALRACSFSARFGEVHAVVGENGSGKSTLAKLLAGVLRPDSGTILVNDRRPASPRQARADGVAVVFQEILVAEGGSVLDNLFIGDDGLLAARRPQREKRAMAQALLTRLVGAPVELDAPIETLPLNLRQWVVIARALLGEPRVVVFDESTAALDHSSAERFLDMVRRLRDEGVCVLIVTHRIQELASICDRATVLSDGKDVGTLAGAEITEPRLLALMRGDTRGIALPAAGATAAPPPSEAGEAALAVSGLKLTPETAPIDFAVRGGEIVGLAGLEGHGQIEFIQAITGFRAPAAGSVVVTNRGSRRTIDSARAAERAEMAYIPGDRKVEGLFPNLSVFENFGIACYRRATRLGFIDLHRVRAMFHQQVADLAVRLGSPGAPINSLSGGNQQKIVIGRALAAKPRVLALNDPTRGVDIGAKRDLYALLHGLAAEGKAIVFLSNEIEEFPGLCNRVAVFRSGTVFRTIEGAAVTSDAVLAAMFGYDDMRELDDARH
jgi:ribose transport system ATP-binding protein